MPKDETVRILIDTMGNARRENRDKAARFILNQPVYFEDLLTLALQNSYTFHFKAAWVLELVLEKNLQYLYPYLDFFCEHLTDIQVDSAARPLSKISAWFIEKWVKNIDPILSEYCKEKQIQELVQANFDWLIGDFKTATKVFAIDSLFYLGKLGLPETDWIHEQLQAVLSEQMSSGTPGFQNHGKKILHLLR